MNWIYHTVRHALVNWGYWAVLAGLLAEDAGLPMPGETILMFAAFLAHKTTQLQLGWIIVVGIVAAILGDNLGFLAGRWIGPHLLRWLEKHFGLKEDIEVARQQIQRHGPATVFWARYIFGLRTVAGPVAGTLGMEWRKFLLFNALGAATWVAVIAGAGYMFADEFQTLLGFFEKASWGLALVVFGVGYLIWRHKKKNFEKKATV